MENKYLKEEVVGREIVDIAYNIHKKLGPGLLESIYEKCFCYELQKRGIQYISQQKVTINYDLMELEEGLRLDLLVENMVIVELKAQENFHPVWQAQLISYLRMTNKSLGFIINFTVPKIKDGIQRIILRET